jgi:pimeloyl-ACP methyl ester carboxylesterase
MTASAPGRHGSSLVAVTRPSIAQLGLEPWRASYEFIRSFWSRDPVAPAGDGHRVIVFPGLGSSTWAIAPMLRHCRRLGYAAEDWGRGINTGPAGDIDEWLHELAVELKIDAQPPGETVTLVGWSLGGLYARELAKLMPGKVRQVVTIGTPFSADADYTRVGWLFSLLSGRPIHFDQALVQRLRTPPAMPTTSIYTRQDGVVAWQTCIHHDAHPQVQDIEVVSSHLGMGWNPAVMAIVADRLAQPAGQWRRYRDLRPTQGPLGRAFAPQRWTSRFDGRLQLARARAPASVDRDATLS